MNQGLKWEQTSNKLFKHEKKKHVLLVKLQSLPQCLAPQKDLQRSKLPLNSSSKQYHPPPPMLQARTAHHSHIYFRDPWVNKIPWRRKWQPTLVFMLGTSRGQRSLAGYNPRGHKELDTTKATEHACIHQNHLRAKSLAPNYPPLLVSPE